jgi:hypothetical protein
MDEKPSTAKKKPTPKPKPKKSAIEIRDRADFKEVLAMLSEAKRSGDAKREAEIRAAIRKYKRG